MKRAIEEALKVKNDVPVGAIIVKEGSIISACHNLKEEILEPCPMCAWAILQARIKTLYFGSYDTQYGGFSVLHLDKIAGSNIKIYGGIEEIECDKLLERFFKNIR